MGGDSTDDLSGFSRGLSWVRMTHMLTKGT